MATPTPEPRYNLDEWAAATDLGRRVFNYNYTMTGTELPGWELVKTVDMAHEQGLTERLYIWEKKGSDGRQLIRVGITETYEWRRAQAQLQTQLVYSMRPDIPRGKGKIAKIGDVSYAAQPEDAKSVASVLFTRGNLSVSINSVGEEVADVSVVASKLDRTFTEPPAKKDLQKERAEDRSPKPIKLKKNERKRLLEALPERVPRSGWFKIIVPDGEVIREDDSLVYVSAKAGSKAVAEFVVMQE
jgi:hypothetical protein